MVIEEELEILYDAYFDELEKYGQNAKLNKALFPVPMPTLALPPPIPPPLPLTAFRPPTIANQEGSEEVIEDLAALAQSIGDPEEFMADNIENLPNQGD